MKRALIIGAGTVAGAAAVLAYQPGSLFAAESQAASTALAEPVSNSTPKSSSDTSSGTSSDTSSGSDSTPQPPADTTAPEASTTQVFTGDAYSTQWGPVQVEATVTDGQLVSILAVQYPANDQHSYQLSAMAIPVLAERAIAAQSAEVDGVSGASYTSMAFSQSLQSALIQAGL